MLYLGMQIPCIISSETQGLTAAIGGKEEEIVFSVVVRKCHFKDVQTGDNAVSTTGDSTNPKDSGDSALTEPMVGKRVLINQKEYRIISKTNNWNADTFNLDLGSVGT